MGARRVRMRATATLVAALVMAGSVGAAAQSEPPRRHEVLPGLAPLDSFVDPSEPWYDQAVAGMARARQSFAIVQNGDELGWPPLSGFIIGANHVVTAHLSEMRPGDAPRRFVVRFIDGQVRDGVQVAGWQRHDFGVIALESPIDLPPIEFGDERAMRRGDVVLTIGNPSAAGRSGLALTSAGRFFEARGDVAVFDVSTGAGGSGGPVVDLDGRLIAMSSQGFGLRVVSIDQMKVADLELRNSFPVERGGGEGGVAATVLRRLTTEFQR